MFIGAALVVLGVVLVMFGLDAADFLASRLSGLFQGTPTNRTIGLLAGGALALLAGLSLAFFRRTRPVQC